MAHTLAASAQAARLTALNLDTEAIITARSELAACFQLAALHGLEEGICNHFSAMVPGHDDLFLVNPYGYAFAEVTAQNLLVCDFDGNVLEGEGQPEATAFYIHARLHKQLPRVKVAFHTHMPHATALCLLQGPPLLWLGQTALKFYERLAVDEDYQGLALNYAEGERIARAAGDADVLMLKNHGPLVLGPSIAEAWDDLYYLERACQAQVLAASTGVSLTPVDPALAARVAEQTNGERLQSELFFASLRRMIG